MKQSLALFLSTLAVNAIVLYAEEGEDLSQHAIVDIKRESDDAPITAQTPVELQPEFGDTIWAVAGDLKPAVRARARIVLDVDFTLTTARLEDLAGFLKGNIDSAINQGLLTADLDATVDAHEIEVSTTRLAPLFSEPQRVEIRDRLIEDMIDSLTQNESYATQVCRDGHVGYQRMTDHQLRAEFQDQLGSLSDHFDWADEDDVDSEDVEAS